MPKITVQITTTPSAWAPSWPQSPLMMPSTPSVSDAVPAGAVAAVGEDADGEHAEGAAHAVHRDRADRVVDLQLALDEEHRLDDEDTGDDADDRRRPRSHEGARAR